MPLPDGGRVNGGTTASKPACGRGSSGDPVLRVLPHPDSGIVVCNAARGEQYTSASFAMLPVDRLADTRHHDLSDFSFGTLA